MTESEMAGRISALENAFATIRCGLLAEIGINSANGRALEGVLEAAGGIPGLQNVISRIEHDYAGQLVKTPCETSISSFAARAQML